MIPGALPHAVLFVPNADTTMVPELGREIRFQQNSINMRYIKDPGPIAIESFDKRFCPERSVTRTW